jgi:tetratricopeptide (TPR) repeat protein
MSEPTGPGAGGGPADDAAALQLRAARSVAGAKPGEMLVVDRRGNLVSPGAQALRAIGGWSLMAGAVGAIALVYGAMFGAVAGVGASVATAGFVAYRMRHWPALRQANALLVANRWEEARERFAALDQRRLPAAWRPHVRAKLAVVDYLLGDLEGALRRADQLVATVPGASLIGWQARFLRAGALAHLGRIAAARSARDQLSTAPDSELFELMGQSLELAIAFEADAPGELPDDDTLHDWARAALGRTQFGDLLVSLAWAFEARGDVEMARHLLAEASSRIPRDSLPAVAPRLHAWAEARRAAWQLGDDDPA